MTTAMTASVRLAPLRRWWLVLALVPVLLSCGGGRGSAEDAYLSLRSALRTAAMARVLELHDAESQAYFRQRVRTVRARVAEGEPVAQVLAGDAALPADYLDGTLDEAAARILVRAAQLAPLWRWIVDGTIIAAATEDGPGGRARATLRVRAVDGTEQDLYFVREESGGALDAFRHFQESLPAPPR